MEENLINKINELLLRDKSFSLPFPMGVFGTLRENFSNHYLMRRAPFKGPFKAFLPNFVANGLSLHHCKNASAPFEIYYYEPKDWNHIIGKVDNLEGFDCDDMVPGDENYYSWSYYRTLAYLHVLPDDFQDKFFEKFSLYGDRDVEIVPENWDRYPRVPCWLYSNKKSNAQCDGYPVIWG